MTDHVKTPWHLWAVGIITLLWNGIGIFSYLMTRLGKLESLGMTAEDIAFFESFPAWANALWAMGVWGAFAGSILLLLRSRWAVTSLVIAVIGLLGTTYFQRMMIEIPEKHDSIPLSVMIWVITVFMLWYASRMKREGVLR
ncbi:hypothetical protein HKD42_02020 [Altererythrobacter sp. RZ02]|uniref:Sugar transporter n=1 Tax=Pontixanthobacter rizhaonensis TaxID=2730337 RepID=A0A848QIH8_9SPHN|nr:hypothetical protein [Pontixanthobacter rizhaonensis]NMW30834.1 hypothetical protein [Pontixanthobacter rizhaonensis]